MATRRTSRDAATCAPPPVGNSPRGPDIPPTRRVVGCPRVLRPRVGGRYKFSAPRIRYLTPTFGYGSCGPYRSQPVATLEDEVQADTGDSHQEQRERIAVH